MINFLRTLHGKKSEPLYILLVVLSLSACGGGGGDDAPADTTAPESTLKSPLFSRTTSNSFITVTGSSSDNQSTITAVTVNGVDAESKDGFANWSANLPLSDRINDLNIQTEDAAGNQSKKRYTISFSKINNLFSEPSTLAIDNNSNKLLINDALQHAQFTTDLSSPALEKELVNTDESDLLMPHRSVFDSLGQQEIILDFRETEPLTQAILAKDANNQVTVLETGLVNVIDMSIDQSKRILYVLFAPENTETGAIIKAYDLEQNQWATLSDDSKPGTEYINPTAIIFHNGRLFCADGAANRLLEIDLSTGTKSTLSDDSQSNNTALSYIKDITAHSDKLWLLDEDSKRIIEINTVSGERSILSDTDDSYGMPFDYFNHIVVDKENNRLLVSDTKLNVIFSVELTSGKRELFISNRHGHGTSLSSPNSLKHAGKDRVIVVDSTLEALISVNMITGNRKIISTAGSESIQAIGYGPSILDPIGIEVNPNYTKAWISLRGNPDLLEIHLDTGNRSLLESTPDDNAATFKLPNGISYDTENHRLLVSDIYLDRVQAIKLENRTTSIAGRKHLTNNRNIMLSKPLDTVVDAHSKHIYAIDSVLKAVVVWDAQSKSKILSSSLVGSGVSLLKPVAIDLNTADNVAYIADEQLNSIVSVNLLNGDRVVLSNQAVGTGPTFKKLASISFDPESRSLLVSDTQEKAIFSIDINTGNRKIVSK
jgi:sugar lactone lactonase YvrE